MTSVNMQNLRSHWLGSTAKELILDKRGLVVHLAITMCKLHCSDVLKCII